MLFTVLSETTPVELCVDTAADFPGELVVEESHVYPW